MNWTVYLIAGLMAAGLTAILTPLAKKIAFRVGAVDMPGDARRIHKKPMPRLGGLAIYVAFVSMVPLFVPWTRELMGLILGVTVLAIVGALDDIYSLSPWTKLIWQIIAACIALAGGLGITSVTNPLGGTIALTYGRTLITVGSLQFHITPIGNLLSLIWMVGLINVINFLDGLDGLATGVSGIAAFIMFLLAVGPRVAQPEVALIAIILAGTAFGFLPFNFFPARIFLGDSGSQLFGLTLAMLAIYSGAKLATASLVLGFTILDGLWTVIRRIRKGVSPFKADRAHFHHMLLDVGLSQRSAVLIMYLIAVIFGVVALVVDSYAKLVALIVLILLMAATISALALVSSRRRRI